MDDIEDKWQPDEVIEQLAIEMRLEGQLWSSLLERFREADFLQQLGLKIGRRYDLEPEYFPERKRPFAPEIASQFLEIKYGKRFSLLNSQLVFACMRLAKKES